MFVAPDRAGRYRRADRSIAAMPPCAASASAGASWRTRSKRYAFASAPLACWRRITAPRAGLRSICRAAPAWCSRPSASAGSTWPSPIRRLLAGKLLYVDEVRPNGLPPYLKELFARIERVAELPRRRGPLVDRDLWARSAGGREGRGARPFAAAGIVAVKRAFCCGIGFSSRARSAMRSKRGRDASLMARRASGFAMRVPDAEDLHRRADPYVGASAWIRPAY